MKQFVKNYDSMNHFKDSVNQIKIKNNIQMKLLKLKFILLLILIPAGILAQDLDCPSRLKMRRATPPYKFNSLSKSAQCLTGKKYEFVVPLNAGRDYRISFYASPVFNNNINFRIIDMNTGQKVMDLPGEVIEYDKKGSCVLKPYTDPASGKSIHPYFDFYPSSSTQLKIIIDIPSIKQSENEGSNFNAPEERRKGCVTVFIQDKKSAESGGFSVSE